VLFSLTSLRSSLTTPTGRLTIALGRRGGKRFFRYFSLSIGPYAIRIGAKRSDCFLKLASNATKVLAWVPLRSTFDVLGTPRDG
jgi:hypothetical protein